MQGYQREPLGPGEETNLEYGLFFPTNMPPREFYLNMNMVLGTEEGYFTHQLFNEVGAPAGNGRIPLRLHRAHTQSWA